MAFIKIDTIRGKRLIRTDGKIAQEKLIEEYVKSLDDKQLIILFKKTSLDYLYSDDRLRVVLHFII